MEFLKIWEILLRRKWLIVFVFFTFFLGVVFVSSVVTPIYEAGTKLLVNTSGARSSLLARLEIKESKTEEDAYETDIELAKIRPLIKKLISSLELKDRHGGEMDPDKLVKASLLTKIFPRPVIKVQQYGDAAMIEVVGESPDAEQAAEMANRLASLYVEERISMIRKEYNRALKDIDSQVKKVREAYYQSLNRAKQFMIEEGSLDLSQETKQLLEKISNLKDDYEANSIQLTQIARQIARIRQELGNRQVFRKESKEFTKSSYGKQLEKKVGDLLIEISGKSVELNQAHPEYQQMEKELQKAKELLQKKVAMELESERLGVDPVVENLSKTLVDTYINQEMALAKKDLIASYLDEYQESLLQMPLKHIKDKKLELTLSVHKDNYKELMEYQTELGIAESVTLSNIKLVEPAIVPKNPDFPKKSLSYFMALFLGIFCSLALAFFREYIDNTVKTPGDVKQHSRFTLLGTIPKKRAAGKQRPITEIRPDANLIEVFRRIRNNIRYTTGNLPCRILMVTSAVGGEGKTLLSTNLSVAFANEETRVVLVDMHLRKPAVHQYFDLQHHRGVTDVLKKGTPLETCLQNSGTNGLYVLTAGSSEPDPGPIVESKGFRDLIQVLGSQYEMVIIDAPPVMTVNETITISETVDGLVYVAAAGKTPFPLIEDAHEALSVVKPRIAGLVLNKVEGRFFTSGRVY